MKTLPVLTPTLIGMTPGRSITSRSMRNICSSSCPVLDGAPAVRSTFTLPLATSVTLNGTSKRAAASWIELMRSSRASASAAGPSRASSASVFIRSKNAAVIVRCSGSLCSSRTWARAAMGMHEATWTPLTAPTSAAGSGATSGGGDEQERVLLRRADTRRVETGGERTADPDLAGIGDRLDRRSLRRRRPEDQQLAVHASRCEEVDRPGRDADRHAQGHGAAAHADPADAFDRPLHLPGRAGGPCLVTGTLEEEEKRVAPPLQQSRAPVVRLVEQRPEDPVERVAQQLRADLAASRQTLGERGEAGDVDECERPVHRAVRGLRRLAHPLDQEARHIRLQHLALSVRHLPLHQRRHQSEYAPPRDVERVGRLLPVVRSSQER